MSGIDEDILPSLAGCDWLRDPALQKVMGALGGGAEGETRIVGGAVRNALFDRPVKDVDLATRLPPEQVLAKAGRAGLKAVPTGIEHGTVTVVARGRPFEVTTLRLDLETYGRHALVAFTEDWKEDARRRDFTINALYADASGRVFDPLGGYPDIAARRVRFIGDADARLAEDYLRILRFFRLHAEYGEGELDPEGVAACVRARHGLGQLSAERLGQETRRLMAAEDPLGAVTEMVETGISLDLFGGVAYLLPFAHLLRIEAALKLDIEPMLRLAVLGCAVAEDADRLHARLRLSRAEHQRLAAASDDWWGVTPALSDQERKGVLYRKGPQTFRDRVLASWARRGAAAADRDWKALYRLPERWRAPKLPWRGADLKRRGVKSGPHVGEIMRKAEARWIALGFPDEQDVLDGLLEEAIAAQGK
ncbi:MAG TPA: CCA tRNA nucleotidyltransferase [Hyphomicrobiales bacterium]|nr:CCA tRNA nucleotidyltransferase [Hyphomicrobiales bacterium]